MPKISFEAQYDFEEPDGHKIVKTVYCDGGDLLAIDDPRFKVIEDYDSRAKWLVDRVHHMYYITDFLGQPPSSIELYQPAFLQYRESIPLGDKKINGQLCSGFQQKGAHKQSPFRTFLKSTGMKSEAIENSNTGTKNDELYDHWFAKDTGLLVRGAGYSLKKLTQKMLESKYVEIPAGCVKAQLP